MIDGATGGHLWAERYDRDMSDIFAVQDEVTRTIVGALKVKLTAGEEARREGRGKVSPEVYDLIVRARQTMLQLRPEAAMMARGMLERVIEIDPGLALPYARLSIITFAEYVNRWNGATADNLARATELAEKAIATDETEPQGHIAMAIVLSWQRRLDEAEVHAERAIELDPNSADGYTGLGNVREFQGRHEDAVALYARAYRLDPQWDMALHFMGRSLLALDRFDEAETAFKKRLILSPHSDMTRFYLAALYARTGRPRGGAGDVAGAAGDQPELFRRAFSAEPALPRPGGVRPAGGGPQGGGDRGVNLGSAPYRRGSADPALANAKPVWFAAQHDVARLHRDAIHLLGHKGHAPTRIHQVERRGAALHRGRDRCSCADSRRRWRSAGAFRPGLAGN